MRQEKNEQLVVRLPANLKQKITELAQDKGIKVSQLVREYLEELSKGDTAEIDAHIKLIKKLSSQLEECMNQLIFITNGEDEALKEKISIYRTLITNEKEDTVKLILNKDIITTELPFKLIDKWYQLKEEQRELADSIDDDDSLFFIKKKSDKIKEFENIHFEVVRRLYSGIVKSYQKELNIKLNK